MGDNGSFVSFDDTTANEIKDGSDSSPHSAFKINGNNSQQSSRSKLNKKVQQTNESQKQKEEASPYFSPTKPTEFIGFYVCKEYNGERILGTVVAHNRKNNLLKVEYDDYRIEYLEQEDVRKLAATNRDIVEAQQSLMKRNSTKPSHGKAKRAVSEEESAATKKKKN